MSKELDSLIIERVARELCCLANAVKHDDARVWVQYVNDAIRIIQMVQA